jgi:hypothetical protein
MRLFPAVNFHAPDRQPPGVADDLFALGVAALARAGFLRGVRLLVVCVLAMLAAVALARLHEADAGLMRAFGETAGVSVGFRHDVLGPEFVTEVILYF